jgi:hypothetical protein
VDQPDCFGRDQRTYNQDGLITMHGVAFAAEPRFQEAYAAAKATDSWFGGDLQWRMHVLVWAATSALQTEGDFVECGTNRGGSAMMLVKYLGAELASRPFHLFDTFCGLDPNLSLAHERERYAQLYPECHAQVLERFRPYANVRVVRGSVPATFPSSGIGPVAFLHLDLNAAAPERAALEYFWPKLARGGVVVLDDYNWVFCQSQKESLDEHARAIGRPILSLPTGQGILIKN